MLFSARPYTLKLMAAKPDNDANDTNLTAECQFWSKTNRSLISQRLLR